MKNAYKLRIIALSLVFAVSAAVCFAQSGGRTIRSPEALKEYLDSQPANTPDKPKPIQVTVSADDLTIGSLKDVLQDSGKYVILDLSGSA
jgi:hypothetical protein